MGQKLSPMCFLPSSFFCFKLKRVLVGEIWIVRDAVGGWSFNWKRFPFNWEVELINEMLRPIQNFRRVEEDAWW
jgi:hypothetical protein